MKRSEMLQIIAMEFRKFDGAATGEQRPASYYLSDARELLSVIEKAGMRPPLGKETIYEESKDNKGGVTYTVDTENWESE